MAFRWNFAFQLNNKTVFDFSGVNNVPILNILWLKPFNGFFIIINFSISYLLENNVAFVQNDDVQISIDGDNSLDDLIWLCSVQISVFILLSWIASDIFLITNKDSFSISWFNIRLDSFKNLISNKPIVGVSFKVMSSISDKLIIVS